MYLATRLTKFDIQDWHGHVPGTRIKWWDFLVEDITVELMEGKTVANPSSLQALA